MLCNKYIWYKIVYAIAGQTHNLAQAWTRENQAIALVNT